VLVDSSDKHVGRFGRWAEHYDRSVLQRLIFGPLQERVLEQIAAAVPEPGAVLDVGCGTGQLMRRVAGRFPLATLTGVDPSADMVRVAQASVPDGAPVRFLEAFAEHLPFEGRAFDAVVTTMSFHHWANQPDALLEVRRVLSPGGVFVLADALPVGMLRWVFTRKGHGSFNSPAVLGQMLRDAGFEFVRFVPVARFAGTIQLVVSRVPPDGVTNLSGPPSAP
jgi:ubiquinone/menaquinone biosynthesis C-methylase UbiE